MDLASLGLEVDAASLARLRAALIEANGARRARLLGEDDVVTTVREALGNPTGLSIRHGGEGSDSKQETTLCLALVLDGRLTIGIQRCSALAPGPGRAYRELQPWSNVTPGKNALRLAAWAARAAADRTSLAIAQPAAPPRVDRFSALWAAVLADPDDDRARAVLADAWSERGDARGEYLALRLATAVQADAAASARADALEAAHGTEWTADVRQLTTKQRFSRGLVDEVEMRATVFAQHAARLFELAPITGLVLRGADLAALRKLTAQPLLGRVRRLALDRNVGDAGARLLAGAAIGGLRELALDHCGFSTTGYRLVLDRVPALEWLHVQAAGAGLLELVRSRRALRISVRTTVREPLARTMADEGRLLRRPSRRGPAASPFSERRET